MPKGQCRLCGVESALQLSHILPAFVTRWLRESSGTGKIRLGTSPNRRVQDGPRRHWLCTSCESRLSRSETSFAEKLFYPYVNGGSSHFVYGEWLLHFCVSISWRVLQHYKDESALNNYEPDVIACIAEAERTWKAFLLDQLPHPGRFPQHLFPLGGIEAIQSQSESLSPNIKISIATLCARLIRTLFVARPPTLYTQSLVGSSFSVLFVKIVQADGKEKRCT